MHGCVTKLAGTLTTSFKVSALINRSLGVIREIFVLDIYIYVGKDEVGGVFQNDIL